MSNELINTHAVIPASEINGPGKRLVVFFQGCERMCPGCFNPETHSLATKEEITARELLSKYYSEELEGITVSGGEPFLQPAGLASLVSAAKEDHGLSVIVYTGFSYDVLRNREECAEALKYIDVLVDGGFNEASKEDTLLARGSTNQNFIFLSDRYNEADLMMTARVEVTIAPDGTVTKTGFSRLPIKDMDAA